MRWASFSAARSRASSTPETPQFLPPLARPAEAALTESRPFASTSARLDMDAATLIAERAVLFGFPRPGRVSAGGACHILPCRDGAIALSLARDSDWELLPALLEDETFDAISGWGGLAVEVRRQDADLLIDRARMTGLACARADDIPPPPPAASTVRRLAPPSLPSGEGRPIVLDLSALWAGPLCGHLLERGGARVVKIESPARLDGARSGNARFYELLNQGKLCLSLDLADDQDRSRLLGLIERADIVIESSRPRALGQFGIDAERIVAGRPGLSWIAISAYGRGSPQRDWIGYGDDTAAAAGLCAAMREVVGRLVFAGDALADPLTGIEAARVAWRCWREGGGVIASLALRDVASSWLHAERAERGDSFSCELASIYRNGYSLPHMRRPDAPVFGPGAQNDWPVEALLSC